MGLSIASAVPAMAALHDLSASGRENAAAAGHLASGLRITGAADDAAGLSIGTSLTTQINGLTQALANTRDAGAVAAIADGALGSVADTLQRMRTLVLRAGNAAVRGPAALQALSREVGALTELLDAIAEFTTSGGNKLLDGSYAAAFQVGANGGEIVMLDLSDADMHAANVGGTAGGTGTDLTRMAILGPDAAAGIYTVGGVRADLEALTHSIVAVSDRRGAIGAVTGQLDATAATLTAALTSVISSRSSLMDADIAEEAGRFVASSIASRAAAFVVAQANSSPRAVLRLLDGARAAAGDDGTSRASDRRGGARGDSGGSVNSGSTGDDTGRARFPGAGPAGARTAATADSAGNAATTTAAGHAPGWAPRSGPRPAPASPSAASAAPPAAGG